MKETFSFKLPGEYAIHDKLLKCPCCLRTNVSDCHSQTRSYQKEYNEVRTILNARHDFQNLKSKTNHR